jgi:hypothetical protein
VSFVPRSCYWTGQRRISILVSGTVMKADFGRQGYLGSIEEGENTVHDPQPIR